MHDSVESVELVLIREHDLAQRRTIEAAVLLENIFAPALDDVSQRLSIGAHRFTSEDVGVDDGGAVIGQHSGDF